MHWYYEKRKKPKAAPGATRKNYGVTWWGKQWLQVFENIDFNNRLPRGKTYANNGLVYDLAIKGNTITAKVEGSMNKPYKVTIQVPAFTKVAQSNLIRSITDNPLFLAKLLNREIPPELNDACEQQNIHIFPKSWHEMNGSCSCYDWAIPCKHMAAVVFLVANEIDKNPFVVFDLHDFNLVQALEKNGYTQESDVDSSQIVKLGDLQQPLSALKPSFLFADQALLALDFSLIPACSDNLLLLLSEKPVFYPEGDFKKILAGVYKKAASTPSPKVFLPSPPDLLRSTEHVMLVLTILLWGHLS
jgi:uncharacterized Zn finger protein